MVQQSDVGETHSGHRDGPAVVRVDPLRRRAGGVVDDPAVEETGLVVVRFGGHSVMGVILSFAMTYQVVGAVVSVPAVGHLVLSAKVFFSMLQ